MSAHDELSELNQGFRERYLDYAALCSQLELWAKRFPELVKLESLATTPEGREVWLLTLGGRPEYTRPAVWIDGNMHASELCGSSVALAIAEDVLRLHLDPDSSAVPAALRPVVRDVLFHVMPRMSPDGAEAVVQSARWVRSVPRDERLQGGSPRWVAEDMNGDGRALLMRVEDATGEWACHPQAPQALVPRGLEDSGPFYKLYPEGRIENFDGERVPAPHFLSDNFPDLNRNFPWSWAPEPEQVGAGMFPGSEVESGAVIRAAVARPNLFFWLNFHTFGGVFIRPLGNAPDKKLPDFDRAVFRQIESWCSELTGYPMVSGFEEFTYEEEKALHGDLSDFAYHQRGCIAYVCELWDLFARIGVPRPKRFCDYYTSMGREELKLLADWDRQHNGGRVFPPWSPIEHPQLGRAEVGGFDPRIGVWNPPSEILPDVCAAQSLATLRVAALAPRVQLGLTAETLAPGVSRVRAIVENVGYLPTYVLESAKDLPLSVPLFAEIHAPSSMRVSESLRREVGHLDGWGRGLGSREMAFHVPRSRGSTARQVVEWTVTGSGTVVVDVGSPRTGSVSASLEVSV